MQVKQRWPIQNLSFGLRVGRAEGSGQGRKRESDERNRLLHAKLHERLLPPPGRDYILQPAQGMHVRRYFRSLRCLFWQWLQHSLLFLRPQQNYRDNGTSVNHALVKMLKRIAVDCELPGLLYRISVFDILNTILTDAYVATGTFSAWLCMRTDARPCLCKSTRTC